MRFRSGATWVLLALVGLIFAGCPGSTTEDLQRSPSSAGAGAATTGGSSPASELVGPPATGTGAGTGSSGTANDTVGLSPVTAGAGSTNTLSTPDAVTTRFPGCQDATEGAFWRSEVLRLVNQERRSRGLTTLAQSTTLEAEATQYACEMIYYKFFDHVNPQTGTHLRDRATEFGYDYWIIGENLAAGQRSPVEAVQAWMNSPCHRENVLNPAFTELGIGVRVGGDYGYYWVQEFGRPFSAAPYPGEPYHDPECQHSQ